MTSPHPFDLLFGTFREVQFPAIAEAMAEERSLDAFLLAGPAIELLRDLRPDEGLGEAADDFVALVHAAWRYWLDGEQCYVVPASDLASLTRAYAPLDISTRSPVASVRYIQLPPRRLWGGPMSRLRSNRSTAGSSCRILTRFPWSRALAYTRSVPV